MLMVRRHIAVVVLVVAGLTLVILAAVVISAVTTKRALESDLFRDNADLLWNRSLYRLANEYYCRTGEDRFTTADMYEHGLLLVVNRMGTFPSIEFAVNADTKPVALTGTSPATGQQVLNEHVQQGDIRACLAYNIMLCDLYGYRVEDDSLAVYTPLAHVDEDPVYLQLQDTIYCDLSYTHCGRFDVLVVDACGGALRYLGPGNTTEMYSPVERLVLEIGYMVGELRKRL